MPDPEDKAAAADSIKELGEHIRFVHFTLVVTCVGFFASILLSASDVLERAIQQAREIGGMAVTWNAYVNSDRGKNATEWLFAQARATLSARQIQPPSSGDSVMFLTPRGGVNSYKFDLLIKTGGEVRRLLISLETPDFVLLDARSKVLFDASALEDPPLEAMTAEYNTSVALPAHFSIGQFAAFWNQLREIQFVTVPQRPYESAVLYWSDRALAEFATIHPYSGDRQFDSFGADQLVFAGSLIRRTAEARWPPLDETPPLLELVTTSSPFVNNAPQDQIPTAMEPLSRLTVSLPMHTVQIPFSGQAEFAKFAAALWTQDTYERSFPQLAGRTRNLQSLSPSDLVAVLEEARLTEGDPVEVFGVRFSASEIVTWGLLVILLQQIYLTVHLAELGRRLTQSGGTPGVAWVALYPSRVARALTLGSATLLPIATAVFLGAQGFGDIMLAGAAMRLVMGVLVCTTSVLAARELVGLWRTLRVSSA